MMIFGLLAQCEIATGSLVWPLAMMRIRSVGRKILFSLFTPRQFDNQSYGKFPDGWHKWEA